jgi:hypothetical protein
MISEANRRRAAALRPEMKPRKCLPKLFVKPAECDGIAGKFSIFGVLYYGKVII